MCFKRYQYFSQKKKGYQYVVVLCSSPCVVKPTQFDLMKLTLHIWHYLGDGYVVNHFKQFFTIQGLEFCDVLSLHTNICRESQSMQMLGLMSDML